MWAVKVLHVYSFFWWLPCMGVITANSHARFVNCFLQNALPEASWAWTCIFRIMRLWHRPPIYCSHKQGLIWSVKQTRKSPVYGLWVGMCEWVRETHCKALFKTWRGWKDAINFVSFMKTSKQFSYIMLRQNKKQCGSRLKYMFSENLNEVVEQRHHMWRCNNAVVLQWSKSCSVCQLRMGSWVFF